MKKEKTIETHLRRTKSGKWVRVRQHTAKYDAAEAAKEALKQAKGAGKEFEAAKKGVLTQEDLEQIEIPPKELDTLAKGLGVSTRDVASWFAGENWKGTTQEGIKRTEVAVKKLLGEKEYKEWKHSPDLSSSVWEAIKAKNKARKEKDRLAKSAKEKDLSKMNPDKSKEFDVPSNYKKTFNKGMKDMKDYQRQERVMSASKTSAISPEEYKAWYHWDQEKDPKNKAALSVEKALKAKMGTKEYNKYFNKVSDEYSSRGHLKSYKLLEPAEHSKIKSAKMIEGTAKAQKEIAEKMGAKEAAAKFDKIAKEAKAKRKKPFEAFGGVHTEAQMDKIQKDMAEWKTIGGIRKHIEELKKKGHDKKGHTEHPHYLWSVNRLKELQKGSGSNKKLANLKPAPNYRKKTEEERKGDLEREKATWGRELTKEERKKYKTPQP